ncbi:MAG: YjbH domain-containing protein, partial [Deltaproteobacteria bacterium]|nr:YjbH domain-containing protein [Deltaproteobacteria bacterium]
GPGYGDNKDKSIDIKLVLLKEGSLRPALALGATDIHGTGLYTSRYLALSKQLGHFDFTLGLGQGHLGGKSHAERNRIAGPSGDRAFAYLTSDDTDFSYFGGVEYSVTENLRLSAEYSSINYETARFGNKANNPVNLGLKYTLWDYLHLQAAFARGEEFSAGLFVQFPLKAELLLTWKKESEPVKEEKSMVEAARADDQKLAELLAFSLEKDGFSKVGVKVAGPKIWVEVTNERYNSPSLALRRMFLVIDSLAPERIKKLYFALVREDIFQVGLATSRSHLRNFIKSNTGPAQFLEFANLAQENDALEDEFIDPSITPGTAETKTTSWSLALKPDLDLYINDPTGFMKTSFSFDIAGKLRPWKGGLFLATLTLPIYNQISTSSRIDEARPVRSDTIDYLGNKSVHISEFGYDHMLTLPHDIRTRFGLGAFEPAYMGFGGEVFKYLHDGRYGLGLESALVWKRNPDNNFMLHDLDKQAFHTYFLNLYGRPFQTSGLDFGLKIGRFLGGDLGVRFEVSRTYEHFTLGAWYTVTDTSHFTSSFNKGYRDKGVYISIPLSAFKDRPVYGRYSFSLSPWTRDPGQMVRQFRSLFPVGQEPETASSIKNSIWEMRE